MRVIIDGEEIEVFDNIKIILDELDDEPIACVTFTYDGICLEFKDEETDEIISSEWIDYDCLADKHLGEKYE